MASFLPSDCNTISSRAPETVLGRAFQSAPWSSSLFGLARAKRVPASCCVKGYGTSRKTLRKADRSRRLYAKGCTEENDFGDQEMN